MSGFGRRRSVSPSSNCSSDDGYNNDKANRYQAEMPRGPVDSRGPLDYNSGISHNNLSQPPVPFQPPGPFQPPVSFPQPNLPHPPPYTNPSKPAPPPSPAGDRIALTTTAPFPYDHAGQPPFMDADGTSPVYIGSALFEDGTVHPCKIAPKLSPPCRVAFGGEKGHQGRYDLLPFYPDRMEWVRTADGIIPTNRRPVMGGYENWNGARVDLYHARGLIDGTMVPGKTGRHLNGCNIAFGNQEHSIVYGRPYDILCWKDGQ